MSEESLYKRESIRILFPGRLQGIFESVVQDYEEVFEVQIRKNGPVRICKKDCKVYLDRNGHYNADVNKGIRVTEDEFDSLLQHICRHSVYAYEEELKNGYLTVEGGHRIGIVGHTVWEGNRMKTIKYFNSIHIRIAHEIKGVADGVLPYLFEEEGMKSTLLVSPPGRGKTTLLRDLIRKLSNGSRYMNALDISLIDERSEIASCYLGIARNDVGMHTDILDACPKAAGILMVLRSMSPQVIAVDELGGMEDYAAIKQALYLGCRLLATIHGDTYANLKENEHLKPLLRRGGFERILFLSSFGAPGEHLSVCNEEGVEIASW